MESTTVDSQSITLNKIMLPIISFIVNLGFGMIAPLLIYYLLAIEGLLTQLPEELGTISNVGLVAFEYTLLMSVFMLTRAFLARFFGNLSDIIGRKLIVFIGLLGYTVLSYSYTIAETWIHLLIIRMFQGVFSAMVWPVAEALLVDSVSFKERGRWLGIYVSSMFASMIIGPALGVAFYKYAAYTLKLGLLGSLKFPFYILTVISLLSSLMSILLKDTIKGDKQNRSKIEKIRIEIINKLPPRIKKAIRILYIMGFANGIAMGFVMPIMNIFITEYITSDPAVLGLLSSIGGLFGVLASYPSGRLSDKVGRKIIIIFGQLTSRLMTLIIPLVHSVEQLLVVFSIRFAAFNISAPAYRALQGDLAPKQIRGKIFGTVQTLFNLGAALAPLGGYLYKILSGSYIYLLGFRIPSVAIIFWISVILGFLSLVLFIIYVPEPSKEELDIISNLEDIITF